MSCTHRYTSAVVDELIRNVRLPFCRLCRHGLSRTDYHIQYDPQLSFRKFVRERRGRTTRNTAADLTATNLSVRGSSRCCIAINAFHCKDCFSVVLLKIMVIIYICHPLSDASIDSHKAYLADEFSRLGDCGSPPPSFGLIVTDGTAYTIGGQRKPLETRLF